MIRLKDETSLFSGLPYRVAFRGRSRVSIASLSMGIKRGDERSLLIYAVMTLGEMRELIAAIDAADKAES